VYGNAFGQPFPAGLAPQAAEEKSASRPLAARRESLYNRRRPAVSGVPRFKESSMKAINVALIGQGFMGRSHSNAWGQVGKFFKPPVTPVMHTVFGQPEENPEAFAKNWGWQHASTDWEALVKSPDIGLVDVVTPNFMHAPVAKAALAAGKPCSCEKPIAATLQEAREMAQAARKAGVKTFVWFNYRRCPAVALAHQLVKQGKIGEIRHVRAS
jgi:predicted dehydrogenase